MCLCHLSYCDCIETQIRDRCKYREVVIDFGIEAKSLDAQVLRQESYQKYGDDRRSYFAEYLCSGIGKYFFHERLETNHGPFFCLSIIEIEDLAS